MIYYLLLMVLYLYKKKGTASGLYFHSFFYTISYIDSSKSRPQHHRSGVIEELDLT